MLKSELKDKVTQYIKVLVAPKLNLKPKDVNIHWVIDNDLHIDSIDKIELEMELEDAYDIHFEDSDAEKIKTIEDLINMTTNKAYSKQ